MAQFKKRELASDVPLGKQLKAVRRTAGLSLDSVSQATKIRKQFIKALEDGNYDELPADVYARGFMENYAKFLGFPTDELLLQYKRERGVTGRGKPELRIPKRRSYRPQLAINPRTLWISFGVLSFLLAVGYIISQVSGFAAAAKLEVTKPAPNANITSETVDVEGITDSGAQLSINNQPVPTDPNGGFHEQVRLLSGTNTLRIAAKNKTGREKVVTRTVVAQIPGQTAAGSPSLAPVPAGFLLTVKIGPNSAYLMVNADGKTAFQGVLTPNTEQTFSVLSRLLLTTSNAGSTRVLVNGQDRGPVGNEGQTRRGIEYLPPVPTPAPTPSLAR